MVTVPLRSEPLVDDDGREWPVEVETFRAIIPEPACEKDHHLRIFPAVERREVLVTFAPQEADGFAMDHSHPFRHHDLAISVSSYRPQTQDTKHVFVGDFAPCSGDLIEHTFCLDVRPGSRGNHLRAFGPRGSLREVLDLDAELFRETRFGKGPFRPELDIFVALSLRSLPGSTVANTRIPCTRAQSIILLLMPDFVRETGEREIGLGELQRILHRQVDGFFPHRAANPL
mmetsp:Transcript_34922/g.96449  ORF Transcript_34922/g.96449 Transcript_34922/m.96449 type:complete len:230 (+) Transcript_34922:3596-4285(+)